MSDLSAIEGAIADPRFPSTLPLARMLRESKLSSWLQRMTSNLPNTRLWAITTIDIDSCIGTVALVEEKSPDTWWLSYWLAPSEWNKGLATEAVGSLLDAASQREAYARVVAAVARGNLPSIGLLRRLGFIEASASLVAQAVPQDHVNFERWLRAPCRCSPSQLKL